MGELASAACGRLTPCTLTEATMAKAKLCGARAGTLPLSDVFLSNRGHWLCAT
jgi:hypothetical protein